MDYAEMIKEWCEVYVPDATIYLTVQKYTSSQYLGYCKATMGLGREYTCIISINKVMWDSIVGNSVAWHEFVHLWDFIESGSMGHGWKWLKKCLRKPCLFLKVYVLFPVVIYRWIKG